MSEIDVFGYDFWRIEEADFLIEDVYTFSEDLPIFDSFWFRLYVQDRAIYAFKYITITSIFDGIDKIKSSLCKTFRLTNRQNKKDL